MDTIFISYGRKHSLSFAEKLHKHLSDSGFSTWFDLEDIPPGVDFREHINVGIEQADNFVFIISPHSVQSEYCFDEISTAAKYG